MKVAFHFDSEPYEGSWSYGPPIQEHVFRALCSIPADRRHVRLDCGDLILWGGGSMHGKVVGLVNATGLSTLDAEGFQDVALSKNIYVVAVEGLTREAALAAHRRLGAADGYLGALQIDPRDPLHLQVYPLIPKFRVVGDELRVFYGKDEYEAGGDRDDWMFSEWQKLPIFSSVKWEDTGLRHTIFDEYATPEYASRVAEVEGFLAAQFGAVSNEILLRTRDVDPALIDVLHAALGRFDHAEQNAEQLAQVAFSCRRFLERLADALFPPRPTPPGGRRLGNAQYKNRLWAYIDENLAGHGRELVLASLEDVGRRLDRLVDLTNVGVHEPRVTRTEVQRLLIGLATLTYDVLMLAPPPTIARSEPYEDGFRKFMEEALEDDDGDEFV